METQTKNTAHQNYSDSIPMSAWAEDDIPTNKLLLKGTNSLSNSELLSIIIGSGIEGDNSLDIAMRLLSSCSNNLGQLWRMGVTELKQIRGIGEKRALQMVSVFALARRGSESEILQREKIKSSRDAFQILQNSISDIPYEEFWIILMDKSNRVIRKERVSEGGIAGTVVDPKRVFKVALENFASGILLGHNHPSGNVSPSEADIKITQKLISAGKLLEIVVFDHLIISGDQYFSFADDGKL